MARFRRRPMIRRKPRRFHRRRFRRIPRVRFGYGIGKHYKFKQLVSLAPFDVPATTLFAEQTYNFSLADVNQSTTFDALFDQYRITGVKVTIYPSFNMAYDITSGQPNQIPLVYSVIDYDQFPASITPQVMYQYQTFKKSYFTRPHSRFFRPRALQSGVQVAASSFVGQLSVPQRAWMDMANRNVLYYGLILGIDFADASQIVSAFACKVEATYYLQFRSVK